MVPVRGFIESWKFDENWLNSRFGYTSILSFYMSVSMANNFRWQRSSWRRFCVQNGRLNRHCIKFGPLILIYAIWVAGCCLTPNFAGPSGLLKVGCARVLFTLSRRLDAAAFTGDHAVVERQPTLTIKLIAFLATKFIDGDGFHVPIISTWIDCIIYC